jgi:hypothetical protein
MYSTLGSGIGILVDKRNTFYMLCIQYWGLSIRMRQIRFKCFSLQLEMAFAHIFPFLSEKK